jgi:hypothetical protein
MDEIFGVLIIRVNICYGASGKCVVVQRICCKRRECEEKKLQFIAANQHIAKTALSFEFQPDSEFI